MRHYIVLDLEWNQSPMGKDSSADRLPFEIIEIGAVKLNSSLQIVSEFRRLIRPRELNQEGTSFMNAMKEFLEWCGTDYSLCTWGPMDLTELQRNIVYHGMEIPFGWPLLYYDVQKIYALVKGQGQRESLDRAVEELGLAEERPFHRALDDAYYTGRVMGAMDFYSMVEYVSVDYYRVPETEEEEIYLEFPSYAKYVSRQFEYREQVMEERRMTDMVCYKCRRMLRKKIRWFSANQKFYFCLAICPEHGLFKGKIRIKKTEDGQVYAVKTVKQVDEEGARAVEIKKEETKKKRSERSKGKRR